MSGDVSPLVLIVDDHVDTREMYSLLLSACGYRVQEAADGEEALATLGETPAVVITDVRMPGLMTAADVCRHFHQVSVPVIVMTGLWGASPEVKELQESGCASVLMKPALPDAVLAEIERVLAQTNHLARQREDKPAIS